MVNVNSNNTFRYGAVIFIFFLCTLPGISIAAGWQWITPQRVSTLVKEGSGLWLVDVRNEAAFTNGHIEGAVHIPAGVIHLKRLPKGKIIVLVDDSLGLRKGRESAEILRKKGYEKVFLLEGGISAWEDEKLPVTGKGNSREFRGVMPEDIAWAHSNRIPLKIFDLREKDEQSRGVVAQAQSIEGNNLNDRLDKVKVILAGSEKKGLAGILEKPSTAIVIFPAAVEPRPSMERVFKGVSLDIRFLEGGYAAWAAKPEKSISIVGSCPTCPKGVSGGKK